MQAESLQNTRLRFLNTVLRVGLEREPNFDLINSLALRFIVIRNFGYSFPGAVLTTPPSAGAPRSGVLLSAALEAGRAIESLPSIVPDVLQNAWYASPIAAGWIWTNRCGTTIFVRRTRAVWKFQVERCRSPTRLPPGISDNGKPVERRGRKATKLTREHLSPC